MAESVAKERKFGPMVMNGLQRLGKSMMMPVAVLPVCGVLMGIGYLLCPASMQGGEMNGFLNILGWLLVKAGGALIDNMAWLFVIGVALGMSEDGHGTACLASAVSWLEMTTLLSPDILSRVIPGLEAGSVQYLAFSKIQNPFIAILAGLIGAGCYNRFRGKRLPDTLAFFSGKRFVSIATVGFTLLATLVLFFVWPVMFSGLVALGRAIVGLGSLGAGIYAFLNRLLIPFGLHHALNNVFWFDTIGIGDLTAFWAGKTSADVSWSLGMYMSGFFPCMMFGVPGAALAMYRAAKDRKKASGILGSTSLCSFICGLTEPFEFSFMFSAFPLYVIYSLLYGVFTFVSCELGFRAGFSFSAGTVDLLFSASLPAAQKTWLILPLGAAAFAVFYLVFSLFIRRFDAKTPGREDEEEGTEQAETTGPLPSAGEDRFDRMAGKLLRAVGGRENVLNADCCATRLRLTLKDSARVDERAAKAAGAMGVIRPDSASCQIVIGMTVQQVLEAFRKAMTLPEPAETKKPEEAPAADTEKAGTAAIRMTPELALSSGTVRRGDVVMKLKQTGTFRHVIRDPLGIHARPAGEMVKLLQGLNAEVTVQCGEKTASGGSILGWMQLGAVTGSELTLTVTGPDAGTALEKLRRYMNEKL